LYEGEKGDPEDVEEGFLKSRLLVKARTPPTMLLICNVLIAYRTGLQNDLYLTLICTREP